MTALPRAYTEEDTDKEETNNVNVGFGKKFMDNNGWKFNGRGMVMMSIDSDNERDIIAHKSVLTSRHSQGECINKHGYA